MESLKTANGEVVFRICVVLLLVAGACMVGLDRQTKLLFGFVRRTATYKDVETLKVLIWVDSVAAAYNLLQLIIRHCSSPLLKAESRTSYLTLAWVSFIFDQVAAYIVFAVTLGSGEVGVLAITGKRGFQWMKLCNKYTTFCFRFGGGLVAAFLAFLLMALISIISAFKLFRLYSPQHLMVFKASPNTT